jgi:hypothetical protein
VHHHRRLFIGKECTANNTTVAVVERTDAKQEAQHSPDFF